MIVSDPPFFDVSGGPEEAFRLLQGVRIETTREDLARRRDHGVVGASQTGDRIEQDHDVLAVLNQAFGFLDHHFGDLHVALGRFVERRRNHFAVDRTLHVGDLFWPLVDQQDDQVDLGMVPDDRLRDTLQQHRLTGAGGRDDQTALTLTDRRHQVHDPAGQIRRLALERDPFLRI